MDNIKRGIRMIRLFCAFPFWLFAIGFAQIGYWIAGAAVKEVL